MTSKQQKEISFLERFIKQNFSEEEIKEYLNFTVYGKGFDLLNNRAYQARRRLDISIKGWKEGIEEGILTKEEILSDYDNDEYLSSIDWNKKHNRS
jgi:hypothetical protein